MNENTNKNYTIKTDEDNIQTKYIPETPYYQLRLESLELFERIKNN